MKKKKRTKGKEKTFKITTHEDSALKTAAQYFGDVMLPYFGIKGEIESYGPTELVQADVRKLYEDFNFIMKDGRWIHFEFQTTFEEKKEMRRFREYEASTSNRYQADVITYVLFSGSIENPSSEMLTGISTYRIHPIIMKGENADVVIADIQKKIADGQALTKEDLFPLLLCPLMSGTSSQKERLSTAYRFTKEAHEVDEEEVKKIQAVLYIMADKFLKGNDLDEFKEVVKVTRLGQMLMDDGRKEGREEGREEGILGIVLMCKEFSVPKEGAISRVLGSINISKEEAKKQVEKYW